MRKLVRDVMTKPVLVIRPTTSFKEMVRILVAHRVSALPVVDDDHELLGMVSEGDLLRSQREATLGRMAVDFMTTPPIVVRPATSASEAGRLLREHRIKHVPVVDQERRVVGIVGRVDLLKSYLRPDDDIRRDVEEAAWNEGLRTDLGAPHVSVRQGVVTLEGQVARRSWIDLLDRIVPTIEGVVAVEDRLRYVVDDVADGPRSALAVGP